MLIWNTYLSRLLENRFVSRDKFVGLQVHWRVTYNGWQVAAVPLIVFVAIKVVKRTNAWFTLVEAWRQTAVIHSALYSCLRCAYVLLDVRNYELEVNF